MSDAGAAVEQQIQQSLTYDSLPCPVSHSRSVSSVNPIFRASWQIAAENCPATNDSQDLAPANQEADPPHSAIRILLVAR